MAVSAGVSSVAHGVHYSVLGVGLLGLVALLAPRRTPTRPDVADEQGQRIEQLRAAVASGTLATPGAVSVLAPPPAQVRRPARPLWLPLAVVSAAAAAAVHAAVGPAHFREAAVLGVFFATAAVAQLGWAVWVAVRPSPAAIRLGALGNATLIGLWLVSRTVGVPLVQPGREAVGPWDLACVTFEVVVVLGCLQLDRVAAVRLVRWHQWHPLARWWALASALVLTALSLSGAGS